MAAVKERPILLASVIVMGVMIVIGIVVVFGTIIYRLTATPDEASVAAARGQFGAVNVAVSDGTSLLGTTFIEDRLSIVTSSNGVAEVIIIDTKRGFELGRVRLVPDETLNRQSVVPNVDAPGADTPAAVTAE
jgi:hypothetical protein